MNGFYIGHGWPHLMAPNAHHNTSKCGKQIHYHATFKFKNHETNLISTLSAYNIDVNMYSTKYTAIQYRYIAEICIQ